LFYSFVYVNTETNPLNELDKFLLPFEE